MKRIVLLSVLALALPVSAFANGLVDFSNHGGTISGGSSGLTLTGSELIAVTGLNGMGLISGNLGSVTLSTGALTSGNMTTDPISTFADGTFVITGNGTNGVPGGVIFTGTLTDIQWIAIPNASHTQYHYILEGNLTGTWYNGETVSGAISILTGPTKSGAFNGSINVASGDSFISTVPEPGTLGLMGTGLIGLAGLVRRKLKA